MYCYSHFCSLLLHTFGAAFSRYLSSFVSCVCAVLVAIIIVIFSFIYLLVSEVSLFIIDFVVFPAAQSTALLASVTANGVPFSKIHHNICIYFYICMYVYMFVSKIQYIFSRILSPVFHVSRKEGSAKRYNQLCAGLNRNFSFLRDRISVRIPLSMN